MARLILNLLSILILYGTAFADTYFATITWYGTNDWHGSPNCNSNTAACGFYTYPGYSAAISQNLYGVGPGQGSGPECGTCFHVVGEKDSSGNALRNAGTSIIVMINNLCPAEGNPLCAQSSANDTNQYGSQIDINLCNDSGANAAFFGDDGVGLALGNATQVDCSEWQGQKKYDQGSGGKGSDADGQVGSDGSAQGVIAESRGEKTAQVGCWMTLLVAIGVLLHLQAPSGLEGRHQKRSSSSASRHRH